MAKIKRLGVIKTASFLGLYGVFIGFVFGLFLMIFGYILSSILGEALKEVSNLPSWSFILIYPLAFGVLSFLVGLIFTPLMNLALKIIKGLDLDIEMQEGQPVVNS